MGFYNGLVFTACKGSHFWFLFAFTAAGVVSPYINHSAVYILFLSFEISENILRSQKQMICLDTYSRQVFIYLDPILIYISLWMDCLFEIRKIAACFLWLLLPDDYRVTDEALLAKTTWYDTSSFLWMFSLLVKDLISDFYSILNLNPRNRMDIRTFVYKSVKIYPSDCHRIQLHF